MEQKKRGFEKERLRENKRRREEDAKKTEAGGETDDRQVKETDGNLR